MSINIAVVAHKEADFPIENGYIPFFVGRNRVSLSKKYNGKIDSTGKNISHLNKYYSELTAQYWLWNNSNADIKGLVHYRRYFIIKNHLVSENEINDLLNTHKIIVGRKFKIKNNLTVRQNYEKYHYKSDLDNIEKSLKSNYPEYTNAFNTVMNQHSMHAMNMFIADAKIFNDYSEWLFRILMDANINFDEVDQRSPFQRRSIGFISERLLDVWIKFNNIDYVELETLQTNHPNRKHTRFNKFIEQRIMRTQKAVDKLKRILTGTQK